jgi:CheY-like chemotaxis protein
MTIPRLLVVEDDQDSLDLFAFILSRRYAVFPCSSAAEALASLEAAKPDLVLLDIAMRPVDGLECLHAIRAVAPYSSVPAIAVTGYARDTDRKGFIAAGFQAVVTKPIDDRALLATVEAWLPSTTATETCCLAACVPGADERRGNGRR